MTSTTTPKLAILGMGYVGLATAAIMAASGIKTYVVDLNRAHLRLVENGKSFFFEQGLDSLIAAGRMNGCLMPTLSYKKAVSDADIVISAVGTPDNPDGSPDLTYVLAAATEAMRYLKPTAIFVQKSTVPVGTGRQIMELFIEHGLTVPYVSNPEFLREGTALADSLWFDRIVVGSDNKQAQKTLLGLYKRIEKSRSELAKLAGLDTYIHQTAGEYIRTGLESAELIKVMSNAYLALKISFANASALLADAVGADITEVMDAVGADQRIGRAFLQAGRGYGGGCFPKDVSGLLTTSHEYGVDFAIMQAAQAQNQQMPGYVVDKLEAALEGPMNEASIAVLGLAFKAGTSDTRRSPGIAIANMLASRGAKVLAYDPKANEEAIPLLASTVQVQSTLQAALRGADAVVIATDWPEFVDIPPKFYADNIIGTLLFDATNRCDARAVAQAGLTYLGVGRPSLNNKKTLAIKNETIRVQLQ